MMRSAVDLPQPEGPSRLRNSPRRDVEVERLQRDGAVGEHLADAAQANSGRAASGGEALGPCAFTGRAHAMGFTLRGLRAGLSSGSLFVRSAPTFLFTNCSV